jgi:hypothetical protein
MNTGHQNHPLRKPWSMHSVIAHCSVSVNYLLVKSHEITERYQWLRAHEDA